MDEWSIDDGTPAGFDVGERRVDDMASVVAMIPMVMAPVSATLVVNFADA
jgi:hypothetical protein